MCADTPFEPEPALNPRERWTDDRLDDLAMSVWVQRDIPQRVAVLENERTAMAEDLRDCKEGIEKLHELRSQERKERADEAKEARKERKRDLQWTVGAVFTAAALVIGALGLFLA